MKTSENGTHLIVSIGVGVELMQSDHLESEKEDGGE